MRPASFDRRVLWLPLAVPALAALGLAWDWRDAAEGHPGLLTGLGLVLVAPALFYGLPYLATILVVYPRIPRWSTAALVRGLVLVPAVLSLAAPLGYALLGWQNGHASDWERVGSALRDGLLVGYTYAVVVGVLGFALGNRRDRITTRVSAV